MSDEPTEQDVDMVADWLGALPESANHFDYTDEATTMITADVESLARAVLASDWYAERIAEARREGAADAERTLDRVRALPGNWLSIRCGVRSPGLRAAAESLRAALRGDDAPPPDYAPTGGPVSPFGPFPEGGGGA